MSAHDDQKKEDKMIHIPNDIYEQELTRWCLIELHREDVSEEDKLGTVGKC